MLFLVNLALPGLAVEPECRDASQSILESVTRQGSNTTESPLAAPAVEKHWPFSNTLHTTDEGDFRDADFSEFVLKRRDSYPKPIHLDPQAGKVDGALDFEDVVPEIALENWGEANKHHFVALAERFHTNVRPLVAAYFKQSDAYLDDFLRDLNENGHLIPEIVESLNKVPKKEHHMSVGTFVQVFLQTPALTRPGYGLREIHESLYELQRASNNLGIRFDEFITRLSKHKYSLEEYRRLFHKARADSHKPKKFAQIKRSLEEKAKRLREDPAETLKTLPKNLATLAHTIAIGGPKKGLDWMLTLHPRDIAEIYRGMKDTVRQKFVTNPDLVKTNVSLIIYDSLIFGAAMYARDGFLGGEFGLTLASIIASEIPLTFSSVPKMAALAAREFPGTPTLAKNAVHNTPFSVKQIMKEMPANLRDSAALTAATELLLGTGSRLFGFEHFISPAFLAQEMAMWLPVVTLMRNKKSWVFIRDWFKDSLKSAPTLFAYSALMTLAVQYVADQAGWRKKENISILGSAMEISLWFAVIANLRYKLIIGRIQTPLSSRQFFLERPTANIAMVSGITFANIASGNALWTWHYSPWFRKWWNDLDEENESPESQQPPGIKATAELSDEEIAEIQMAELLDSIDDATRFATGPNHIAPTMKQLESAPVKRPGH